MGGKISFPTSMIPNRTESQLEIPMAAPNAKFGNRKRKKLGTLHVQQVSNSFHPQKNSRAHFKLKEQQI